MSESAEGYFIVAHCVNATDYDRAEAVLAIASESVSGEWWTTDGQRVWPYWMQPVEFPTPAIPGGWIEHLHELAQKLLPPRIDLATALGLQPKAAVQAPPIVRRI